MALTLEEGRVAVELARATLEGRLGGPGPTPKGWALGPLSEERGVFVTLNLAEPVQERLRGCIGFPYPVKKLGEAIQEATIAAATEDPRFPPVGQGELDSIVVEVSILTSPQELVAPRKELPSRIRIGTDGLIISRSYMSGLLLPQVAPEFGMDQMEFLSQACMKAGLPPDAWLDGDTKVQVFQAEIFAEKRPKGEVVRVSGQES